MTYNVPANHNYNPLDLGTGEVGRSIATMLDQVQTAGGIFARWRIARATNAMGVATIATTIEKHLEARRQELSYAIDLVLDEAKKQLLQENLHRVAVIEREIARTANQSMVSIEADVIGLEQAAAREEMRCFLAAKELLDQGKITQARFDKMNESIAGATDKLIAQSKMNADKIIRNICRRIEAAVSESG